MSFKRNPQRIHTPSIILFHFCWLVSFFLISVPEGYPQETVRYSCSNQVYQAFESEKIDLFRKMTAIPVDVFTASSGSAVFRLLNGSSDIASTARPLYQRQSTSGYFQVPFCRDPIAVIVRADFALDEISEVMLKKLFSGDIRNWKTILQRDLPVAVVVPDKGTAAYKNFHYQVLKHRKLEYDFCAQNSTMVIEAVKNLPPGAISFVSQGAAMKDPAVKSLKINGYAPREVHYPYYQTFYYITKDMPSAPIRRFIDFTFSQHGKKIIIKNGMLPIIQQNE